MVYEYFQEQNDFGLVEQSGSTVTPLKDFQPLADAIAAVNANSSSASLLNMNTYTPTNEPRACPAVDDTLWLASDLLPPTPNATVCETMVASSACVPADLDADSMAALFGTVCGLDAKACAGITADASTGTYGDFVMCNSTQQLTAALNQYYLNNGKTATACDFNGQAKVVTPTLAVQSSDGSSKGSSSGSSVSSASANTSNSTSATSSFGGSAASNNNNSSSGIVYNGRNSTNTTIFPTMTKSGGSPAATYTPVAPLLTDPQSPSDASTAAANALGSLASNATSANSTQSSGSNAAASGAAGNNRSMVGSLEWAASLLLTVGAGVALTL